MLQVQQLQKPCSLHTGIHTYTVRINKATSKSACGVTFLTWTMPSLATKVVCPLCATTRSETDHRDAKGCVTKHENQAKTASLHGENLLQLRITNRTEEARLNIRAMDSGVEDRKPLFMHGFSTLAPPHIEASNS